MTWLVGMLALFCIVVACVKAHQTGVQRRRQRLAAQCARLTPARYPRLGKLRAHELEWTRKGNSK